MLNSAMRHPRMMLDSMLDHFSRARIMPFQLTRQSSSISGEPFEMAFPIKHCVKHSLWIVCGLAVLLRHVID